MMRFTTGQRWKVKSWDERVSQGREPFFFVVTGPGNRPGFKLCTIEVPENHRRGSSTQHGMQQEYSHKHLKRHADLVVGGV